MSLKFISGKRKKKVVFSELFMNFEFMSQFCRRIFKIKTDFVLYYLDEDEDMILISSDEDIFVMNHFERDQRSISIFIDI